MATVSPEGTLSIPELQSSQLKLYPNPVGDHLFVELPKKIQHARLYLYSLQGQELGEYAITQNQMRVNFRVLKRGVHIIMIQMDDQINYFKTLVSDKTFLKVGFPIEDFPLYLYLHFDQKKRYEQKYKL